MPTHPQGFPSERDLTLPTVADAERWFTQRSWIAEMQGSVEQLMRLLKHSAAAGNPSHPACMKRHMMLWGKRSA